MNIGRTYEELMPHYRAFLMLERGLSDNTRVAYMADVARLADWASQISTPIADLTSDDLHAFVAEIHSLGVAERTQARIVSGVRSFFRYLVVEGVVEVNPRRVSKAQSPACICPKCLP